MFASMINQNIASCNGVFGIFPENATFEMQIFNLCMKTEGILKGKFPLDYPSPKEYFLIIKLHNKMS
jgi:hypothetical protein